MSKTKHNVFSRPRVFLQYANARLRNSPKGLIKFTDAIPAEFGQVPPVGGLPSSMLATYGYRLGEITPEKYLHDIWKDIVLFGPDLKQAIIKRGQIRTPMHYMTNLPNELRNDYLHMEGQFGITAVQLAEWNSSEIHIETPKEVAFEAAYGFIGGQEYESGFPRCPTFNPWIENFKPDLWYESGFPRCPTFNPWIENLNPDLYPELWDRYPSIMCYECHQMAFKRILDKIILGCDYTEIQGFQDLLHIGVASYRRIVSIEKAAPVSIGGSSSNATDQLAFKMGWRSPYDDISGHFLSGPDGDHPFKHIFNHLVMGLVSYSLTKFLTNPKLSRENLHRCEFCGDFFIGRSTRKTCGKPDCEKFRKRRNSAKSMDKIRKKKATEITRKRRIEAEKKAKAIKMLTRKSH